MKAPALGGPQRQPILALGPQRVHVVVHGRVAHGRERQIGLGQDAIELLIELLKKNETTPSMCPLAAAAVAVAPGLVASEAM